MRASHSSTPTARQPLATHWAIALGQAQSSGQEHVGGLTALVQVAAQAVPPGLEARTAQHQGFGKDPGLTAALNQFCGEDALGDEHGRLPNVHARVPHGGVVRQGVHRHLGTAFGA